MEKNGLTTVMMSDRASRTERETVNGRIQRRKRLRQNRRTIVIISMASASVAIVALFVSVYVLPLSTLEVSLVNNAPSSVMVAVYDGGELLSIIEMDSVSSQTESYSVVAGSHVIAAKISYTGDLDSELSYDYSEEVSVGFLGNRMVEIVLDDYY